MIQHLCNAAAWFQIGLVHIAHPLRLLWVNFQCRMLFAGAVCYFNQSVSVGSGAAGPIALIAAEVIVICDPLGDGFPLQLGKGHNDIDHSAAQRGGGIKIFGGGHKVYTVLLQANN